MVSKLCNFEMIRHNYYDRNISKAQGRLRVEELDETKIKLINEHGNYY